MTRTDLVHAAHRVAYERSSAAEEALTRALPLGAGVTGPVNLTWDQPSNDLSPGF